jgi:hypothetical protein
MTFARAIVVQRDMTVRGKGNGLRRVGGDFRHSGCGGGYRHAEGDGQSGRSNSTTSGFRDCTGCSIEENVSQQLVWLSSSPVWRGALPSVVGGLVSAPVIAVPTSIGYGASFGGVTALLSMLNSCASNVTVVNIDNGFGAGMVASLINRA